MSAKIGSQPGDFCNLTGSQVTPSFDGLFMGFRFLPLLDLRLPKHLQVLDAWGPYRPSVMPIGVLSHRELTSNRVNFLPSLFPLLQGSHSFLCGS